MTLDESKPCLQSDPPRAERNSKPYWFHAKRYGWGWGLPATWQGWLVYTAYIAVIFLVAWLVPTPIHPLRFTAFIITATAVLLRICWRKGEPPRWRWGDRES